MSERVQQLFDTIAPRYDLLNSLLSLKTDRRWRKETVSRLQGPKFRRVLDLCAGTLALTQSLLEANPECIVRAVDFSKPMLKKGWETLPIALRDRVELVVGDAMKIDEIIKSEWRRVPLRSERSIHEEADGGPGGRAVSLPALDAIMCAYGMRNIDDNSLVLRKLREALRPGGRLVVLEFFRPEGLLSKLFNATYAQIVIPILGHLISGHPEAYRYLRDSVRGYFTPSAFCELLKETGYINVQAKALTGGVSHLITAEVAS